MMLVVDVMVMQETSFMVLPVTIESTKTDDAFLRALIFVPDTFKLSMLTWAASMLSARRVRFGVTPVGTRSSKLTKVVISSTVLFKMDLSVAKD